MKSRKYFILPIVAAGAVSLTSCGKKEKDAPVADPTPAKDVAAKVADKVADVVKETGSLDELAKKAGFAKYMNKETSAMWTIYDGAGLAKKLRGSQIGSYIEGLIEKKGGSVEDMLANEDFQTFADVAGEELFLALGEGGAEEMEHLFKGMNKLNYYQYQMLVKMMASSMSGDTDNMEQILEDNYVFPLAKDEEVIASFKAAKMPPVFAGFKVSDPEKRKEFITKIQSLADQAIGSQEDDKKFLELVEKDGFKGFKASGEKVAAIMKKDEAELAEMKQSIGEEAVQVYLDAVAQKNFVTVAGEFGDYVVMFAGESLEQLTFAESPSDSVLAHKGMDFAQKYSGKELVSLLYMNEAYAKVSIQNQAALQYVIGGIQAGLEGIDVFGDTRVLEALLADCVKCEKAFYAPYVAGRAGMVAYLEEGFKVDSYYEGNAPAYDLDTKRHLSGLAEMDEVLFSANWVSNPEQVERGLEFIDAVGSTAYQVAKQVSGLTLDSDELSEFKMKFGMLDGMLKGDLLNIWSALRGDLNEGLGAESAVVIDMKGELPTVPSIPAEMIKSAKLPRYSYVSTVKDRAKLGDSWTKLNNVAESFLQKAKQMAGMDLPMQRPFKSTSDGLTSWSFQIPFTHQNCTPHVSVSDDLFILGSSPDFAVEIAGVYQKEAAGAPMSTMTLNFDTVRALGANWISVLDQHGEAMMGQNDYKEFQEMKPMLEGALKAAEELDSLSIKTYKESNELRSSLHFKTR